MIGTRYGQAIAVTTNMKQFNILGQCNQGIPISKMVLFDHKGNEFVAIGLYNGMCLIKAAESLMSDSLVDLVKSANPNTDQTKFDFVDQILTNQRLSEKDRKQSMINHQKNKPSKHETTEDADEEFDKITFLQFLPQPNRIVFGSKKGYLTFYNMSKRETTSFCVESDSDLHDQFKGNVLNKEPMTRILNILELPSKIQDIRKNIYYILSEGNLYAMAKDKRQIQQVFYKGQSSKYRRPRLINVGALVMENQFCLGLLVEGGSLHFLDPMTLQSFAAYQFPAYHQLTEYQFV